MSPLDRAGRGVRRSAPVSRRTALRLAAGAASVVGAGVVSGCELNNPLTEEETPAAEAVRELEADVAVAVEAVTLVRAAQSAVTRTGELHTALVGRLTGLTATHQTHLDALIDAVPDGVDTSGTGTPYDVPGRRRAAVAGLVAAETTLHDGLVGLAMRAESGAFARLLGSMAAAVSQQIRVLSA